MKKKQLYGVVLLLIVGLGLFGASRYNHFIKMAAEADAQWAVVESKLQRRADLVPNLVATVKGSLAHEKDVFQAISDARKTVSQAETLTEKAAADTELSHSLSRLLVVIEGYPELKSSEHIRGLMDQLEGAENRLSVERDRYNKTVKEYNTTIKRFPNVLVAKFCGFKAKTFFEAAEGAEKVPVVDLEVSRE